MPTHCTERISSASAGSACPMLAMFTAIAPPLRTWPSRMPIGQCDQRGDEHRHHGELHVLPERRGMHSSPCHWSRVGEEVEDVAEEAHHATVLPARVRLARCGQGVARRWASTSSQVGDDGQREREHDADGERRAEVALEAVEHQLAEPTLADERGDR